MSANCSLVHLALGGCGVDMAAEGVEHREGEQWWWWGLVVECAAPTVEKFGSKYQDVVARGIRGNEQVTPSQLGQDQFLLDSFLCSTLYSWLVQS
jgi:hypothetical protein